jgi:hypothetical protein
MAVACSEGGKVEVDGGSVTMTKSLRKRIVAACCGDRDEAVACSRVGIMDGRWWRRHGGF